MPTHSSKSAPGRRGAGPSNSHSPDVARDRLRAKLAQKKYAAQREAVSPDAPPDDSQKPAPQAGPQPKSAKGAPVVAAKPGPGKLAADDPRKAMLAKSLVDTGRANDGPASGKLGGKRSAEADERAEGMAGDVLKRIEAGTIDNQKQRAIQTGEVRPLTHAVSGHGKGTDQISRLVHGRRADEVTADASKPADSAALTGNTHGLGDTATPKYDTVGSDPSNKSGAFTSNRGMLHVVSEAFAQADMVSRYAEGNKGSKIADQRMVTTIGGYGDELGYNVEVDPAQVKGSQTSGDAVTPDQMNERYKAVKRTGDQKSATMVMDPAYVDGKRAGWNMQTAFANDSAPSDQFARPEDVAQHEQKQALIAKAEEALKKAADGLKAAKKTLAAAKSAVAMHPKTLIGKNMGLDKKKADLDKKKAEKGANEDEATAAVAAATAAVAAAETEIAAFNAKLPGLKAEEVTANKGVVDAEAELKKATEGVAASKAAPKPAAAPAHAPVGPPVAGPPVAGPHAGVPAI